MLKLYPFKAGYKVMVKAVPALHFYVRCMNANINIAFEILKIKKKTMSWDVLQIRHVKLGSR